MRSKRSIAKPARSGLPSDAGAVRLDALTPRHASILSQVWFNQGLSRSDLHNRTGIRLRTVGSIAEDLIGWGLIEEREPRAVGVGRPQVPLAIASETRAMVGVSMTTKRVIVVNTGLSGSVVRPAKSVVVKEGEDLVAAAAKLVREYSDEKTLAIGVGLTGFVDTSLGEWLLSAAHPSNERVSLKRLIQSAGQIPIVISNELHAMSASARLAGRLSDGDSLLIHLDDGRVAASILVNGKPNQGSVMAANELGHTTMPVNVERCYCGRVGCIERVFSSEFLKSRGEKGGLAQALSASLSTSEAVMTMVDLLCRAVANAINFVRPERVIISSPYVNRVQFVSLFEELLQHYALDILFQRIKLEWQHFDPDHNALAAAALPLASVFERSE